MGPCDSSMSVGFFVFIFFHLLFLNFENLMCLFLIVQKIKQFPSINIIVMEKEILMNANLSFAISNDIIYVKNMGLLMISKKGYWK
jgi:hypothetical protein